MFVIFFYLEMSDNRIVRYAPYAGGVLALSKLLDWSPSVVVDFVDRLPPDLRDRIYGGYDQAVAYGARLWNEAMNNWASGEATVNQRRLQSVMRAHGLENHVRDSMIIQTPPRPLRGTGVRPVIPQTPLRHGNIRGAVAQPDGGSSARVFNSLNRLRARNTLHAQHAQGVRLGRGQGWWNGPPLGILPGYLRTIQDLSLYSAPKGPTAYMKRSYRKPIIGGGAFVRRGNPRPGESVYSSQPNYLIGRGAYKFKSRPTAFSIMRKRSGKVKRDKRSKRRSMC